MEYMIHIPLTDEELEKYIYDVSYDPTDQIFTIDYTSCSYKNDALFLYLFNVGIRNIDIINISEDELNDLAKYYIRSNRFVSIELLNYFIFNHLENFPELQEILSSLAQYLMDKMSGSIDESSYHDKFPLTVGNNIISIVRSAFFWEYFNTFKSDTIHKYVEFIENRFNGYPLDKFFMETLNPYSLVSYIYASEEG